jgi:chemotaxis signal transduction protein
VESLPATSGHAPSQYLLFRLARQYFAIDAARIYAILPAEDLIPLESPFGLICGTAAVCGREVPIVDLRSKLNIPRASQGRTPCMIVVRTLTGGENEFVGFVADRISGLEAVRTRDLRNGFAHTPGRVRRLLDPDQIVSEHELLSFSQRRPD